jgi:hypothetical protein
MTKNPEPKQNDLAIDQPELSPFVLGIDRNLEPVEYSVIAAELGISGPRVPAENLIDTTFIILGAKSYQSSYKDENHVYFCVCKDAATKEVFTTSLGGAAVVDVLDALVATKFNRPLKVTLRQVEGGKFGRYYVLE